MADSAPYLALKRLLANERALFVILYAGIAVAKLALVSGYELGSGGFDAGEYARLSAAGYWTQEDLVRIWDLRRGPGVPLFVMGLGALGIPYFLGMELLTLACFFVLGMLALKMVPLRVVIVCSLFAVFSPALYTEQILMSDQPFALFFFWSIVLMGYCLWSVQSGKHPSPWASGLIGLSAFLSSAAREEGILVFLVVLTYFIVLIGFSWRSGVKDAVKSACITLGVLTALLLGACFLNARHYGHFALSYRGECADLYSELHKISLAVAPHELGVSRQAIDIAAEASPSFREVAAERMKRYRERRTANRVGGGFNDILRSLDDAGLTSRQGLSFLDTSLAEIREGTREIEKPAYVYPFGITVFDADNWLRALPSSMWKVTATAFGGFRPRFLEQSERSEMYNRILNRRTQYLPPEKDGLAHGVRSVIIDSYAKFFLGGCLLLLAFGIFAKRNMKRTSCIPLAFIAAAVLLRIVAYALLDAFLFPQTSRHIVNINPMLIYISLSFLYIATANVAGRFASTVRAH